MELHRVIEKRRMIRAFEPTPIDRSVTDKMCDLARRAPSAGNTQAVEFLVLDDPAATARYWDTTLPRERRSEFRWQTLPDAPVLVIVVVRPEAYVERYAEPDKARPGLGDRLAGWSVPFWWVDAGAVIQNLLLQVTAAGLGACLFGLFDNEAAVLDTFGVPSDWRAVATIAIGHPRQDAFSAGQAGRSSARSRPPAGQVIHRGRW